MSQDAAFEFINHAVGNPELLKELSSQKGAAAQVTDQICAIASKHGFTFNREDFDIAVKNYIRRRVSADDISLEEYRAASQYVMGTGSIICCCSHWSHTT